MCIFFIPHSSLVFLRWVWMSPCSTGLSATVSNATPWRRNTECVHTPETFLTKCNSHYDCIMMMTAWPFFTSLVCVNTAHRFIAGISINDGFRQRIYIHSPIETIYARPYPPSFRNHTSHYRFLRTLFCNHPWNLVNSRHCWPRQVVNWAQYLQSSVQTVLRRSWLWYRRIFQQSSMYIAAADQRFQLFPRLVRLSFVLFFCCLLFRNTLPRNIKELFLHSNTATLWSFQRDTKSFTAAGLRKSGFSRMIVFSKRLNQCNFHFLVFYNSGFYFLFFSLLFIITRCVPHPTISCFPSWRFYKSLLHDGVTAWDRVLPAGVFPLSAGGNPLGFFFLRDNRKSSPRSTVSKKSSRNINTAEKIGGNLSEIWSEKNQYLP